MMVGLMILSLSRSLSDESMKRVRIKGLLIPMYWIAKGGFGVSFERFVRKSMYVFGVICMLTSVLLLGEAVYQLII
ncbi:Transcriptional regulator [Priestia megaterium]|uniref:hypothetical protein n=1 Tax=Priestia TaxID=2800373 RepID=UPI0011B5464D|nr:MULTISPECIES: hypothetical protein [Priestia]MCG0047811.1 hypothetical protein [Priestia aryabhattai]QDZ86143.1 hypothetical protein D0441_17365 [Priestia megaterium]